MQRVIEKIAVDNGLSTDQVNCAYTAIMNHLLDHVPELEKIVETVFANSTSPDLYKEINKLVNLLQFRGMEHLKNRSMPDQRTYRFQLTNELF